MKAALFDAAHRNRRSAGKASRAASGENHSWSAEYACRSGGREQDHKEEFARSTCQGCLEEGSRVPVDV